MTEEMGTEYAKGYKAGTKATAEEAMENMKAMVEHAKILMYESQTAVAEVQRLRDLIKIPSMTEEHSPLYLAGYIAGAKASEEEAREDFVTSTRVVALQLIGKITLRLKAAMGPGYELETDALKLIEKLPQRLADEYYRGYNDTNGDGFE